MSSIDLFGKSFKAASTLRMSDGLVPLTYWTVTPNFGDLLSPYLVEKLTGRKVKHVYIQPGNLRKVFSGKSRKSIRKFSYLCIGSIASRTNDHSIVWGAGTFGTETAKDLDNKAKYLAVRGPLTRNMIRIVGGECPEVYGDPALLYPAIYSPVIEKTHEIGLIVRWPESDWASKDVDDQIKIINFGTSEIEKTLDDILSCKKIVSSSLHGLILADAYGIPSAWLASDTPKGFEHKFYDYFLSVDKVQRPQMFDLKMDVVTLEDIYKTVEFYDRSITYDPMPLLQACPFIDEI